jgi:tetratricopeptide (TPR) repeat protein
MVLTGCADGTARLWDLPELPDDLDRISSWVEVITGMETDGESHIHLFDMAAWNERRQRLYRKVGPPTLRERWRLDPILFGPEPTARARAWIERERWAEAETAFDEVVRARPLDAAVRLERARFFASRSQLDKADDDFVQAYALGSRDSKLVEMISRSEALFHRALEQVPDSAAATLWSQRGEDQARRQQWAEAAADFGESVRLRPEDGQAHRLQILSLSAAGERDGLRWTIAELLDKFRGTTDPGMANMVAWNCCLAPDAVDDPEAPVQLAEIAVKGASWPDKANVLNTLGATLYRAGRFDGAIRRLEEGIQVRNGTSVPMDWPFLAMAHFRLGHRDEARRWLDRFQDPSPDADPDQFWSELEIRLLRSEAEALILYDPAFPADPFAN